jgi:hypothetical protein
MKQVVLSYLRKCFSFVLNASSSRSPWLFPDIVFYLTPMGRELIMGKETKHGSGGKCP